MKLSEFKGDEALNVLAELMEPVTEIMGDQGVRSLAQTEGTPVIKVAHYVIKNHSENVFKIYEAMTKESRENATPQKLIKFILDIADDPELIDLFTTQGQNGALTSSGSAMENTEEGEN